MGAGFHSIGRGTPDKQVTEIDGTGGLPTALAVVVPSPPAGIARVVGVNESQFASDVAPDTKLFNPTANPLDVNFFIDGPDGTNLIASASELAATTRADQVLLPGFIIEEGETVQAQIIAGGETGPGDQARVVAGWTDYRMDDVLKLNRLVVASGQAFADIIPAPPAGARHVLLGIESSQPSIVVAGEGGSIHALQLLDNGVPTALGSFTGPADSMGVPDGLGIPLNPGQSLQVDGEAGTGVFYVSFLKVPSNP